MLQQNSPSTPIKKASPKASKPKDNVNVLDAKLKSKSITTLKGTQIISHDAKFQSFTPEERHQMIAEAAYFRAEKRGFVEGGEELDWQEAQTEINRMF